MNPLTHPFQTRGQISEPAHSGSGSWSPHRSTGTEPYDSSAFRFVVVISSRLDAIAAADAIAHSLVALGSTLGRQILGDRHSDGDGQEHARLARYPVVLLSARPWRIGKLLSEASPYVWVTAVDYPEEGHATTHDDDYRSALAHRRTIDLSYRSAAFFGPSAVLDALCGHFALYRA